MNFFKKYLFYIITSLFSICLCWLIFEVNDNYFEVRRETLMKNANTTNRTNVQFIIDEIEELRKYNDDSTVKKIIHDQIDKREVINHSYMCINEVKDWNGGPEFAIRFVNQNLVEDEGDFLDTNFTNKADDYPYKRLLEGIKEDSEIYFSQYCKKNYDSSSRIFLKHSYAKLYKDFNWIVCCGIPDEYLFSSLNYYEKINRNNVLISNLAIILATIILFVTFHERNKRSKESLKFKIDKSVSDAKSKAKTEFLSTISHELRTPLNAIIGLNSLLSQNPDDKTQVIEYSRKIDESSRMLLVLINDILDMAAIEKGKLKIAKEKFNLHILIHGISEVYYNLANQKNLKFVIECYDLNSEILIGDSYRIRQILINLLSNSLKFTSNGIISLKVFEEIDGDNVILNLVVSDTGCGMNEETLLRIFDQFEQADASVARCYGGSGLGLSITKQLVDLMNGDLEVESLIDQGTIFTIKIPLETATNEIDVASMSIRQKLLVIGKDKINNKVLQNIFNEYNIEFEIIEDSKKAILNIEEDEYKYNTFIIDYNDDSYDSLVLADSIKTINKNSLIVMITDYNTIEVRKNNLYSIDYLIQSPFITEVLLKKLSNTYHKKTNQDKDFDVSILKDKSILIVDDNKINLLVATNLLRSIGVRVTTLNDGKSAVNLVKSNPFFDAVLMDIRMPIMDGLTATKLIREFNREIPIIALSANAFEEDIKKSRMAGMNHHISKPINKELFYKILCDIIISKAIK